MVSLRLKDEQAHLSFVPSLLPYFKSFEMMEGSTLPRVRLTVKMFQCAICQRYYIPNLFYIYDVLSFYKLSVVFRAIFQELRSK